ncbi:MULTISPECIES: DUF2268 domain-containing protein [Bacillus]|uniref:DUF2268 domain-containing protein n=1 Tax=Bacillus TaxID=1386 RepID=UPI0005A34B98|nr:MULTISPECIES: DUF2268 domain-containing putative Zn-dependent protease [Bacillus cereus group]AJG61139.1 hypothetical protein AW22_5496 [Bacillus cereus D17]MCU5057881.1 DUF2268 domain-containing putative Zn-dependent protease [Bacillus cereus]QKI12923.1 hypothetical protein FOC91_13415 [Bacillus cereus]USL01828.1 DUF2268 domain-containing putative Zn-dependent protease [Bacillus anthracis]SMD84151.1 hypothetical protein BACERE00175_01793 [Bacillus cereus]
MKIFIEDTISQYDILLSLSPEERENFFRHTMMKPFEGMWNAINVSMKSKDPKGYDVMMATRMLGYLDINETKLAEEALNDLKKMNALKIAEKTLKECIDFSSEHDLRVSAEELRFGMYIADPKKLKNQNSYTGFGGIPGYVIAIIRPNSYNVPRFPALIAHEFHHNLRFSYFEWNHGDVTVADYIIIEGLADSFATALYGKEFLGPWVTSIDNEDLEYSIYVIKEGLNVKGFAEVSSYMFGDDFAKKEGYQPVGLSTGAGYAVGYHIVQSFMKNNNVTIQEATLLSTEEIIKGSNVF